MLGPANVGERVVVRIAETPRTPPFTDVLGMLVGAWPTQLRIRRDRPGAPVVTIPIDHLVAGKPIPARPARPVRLQEPG